jgi:hypothetical protein
MDDYTLFYAYHQAARLSIAAYHMFGVESHQFKRMQFVVKQRYLAWKYPQFA